jgi:diadenosine tetraphosphate (Ap4A) HIT family hydrolase
MNFILHPNLSKKDFVIDLPLSRVLLENEAHYPWIFLVPRRPDVARIMDLNEMDQLQLIKELDLAQKILWSSFPLTQLNVAAIGNKTPQLHVHVIGRHSEDPAWPNTVWDHPTKRPYSNEQKQAVIEKLQAAFAAENALSLK